MITKLCCLSLIASGVQGNAIRPPNSFDDGKGLPKVLARQTARVVDVISGDTVVVDRFGFRKNVSIHLWGLSAPVQGQKYFAESKANLKRLLGDKEIVVFALDSRSEAWVEAFVECNLLDSSLYLMEHFSKGLVWWDSVGAHGWTWARNAEALVRSKKVGIWSELKPEEPRLFRLRQLMNSRGG